MLPWRWETTYFYMCMWHWHVTLTCDADMWCWHVTLTCDTDMHAYLTKHAFVCTLFVILTIETWQLTEVGLLACILACVCVHAHMVCIVFVCVCACMHSGMHVCVCACMPTCMHACVWKMRQIVRSHCQCQVVLSRICQWVMPFKLHCPLGNNAL